MMEVDFVVVGGGIVGLAIGRELVKRYPGARIAVLEKEPEIAFHASGRNSGVLHAGFYYTADSLKARFTLVGNRAMSAYCLEHGLPIRRCGKVVVATDPSEVEGIYELKRRGDRNGVDLRLIDAHELADIEPNAVTVEKALFSPTTSSVAPRLICRHIAAGFPPNVRVLCRTPYLGRVRGGVAVPGGTIRCRHLFNAAGLYADRVARDFGAARGFTMIPFKGIYLRYNADDLIRRHIYPVPNLKNPFLGVHFTITADGHIKIGPTAIPAFWRENYDFRSRFRAAECAEILAREAELFIGNHFNFRRLAFEELRKYHRGFFIGQARRLVRRLDPSNFGEYTAPGIRAQLLDVRTKRLVMDFVIEHAEGSTHVLNAVSPAFTSAFSFAAHIVEEASGRMAPL